MDNEDGTIIKQIRFNDIPLTICKKCGNKGDSGEWVSFEIDYHIMCTRCGELDP